MIRFTPDEVARLVLVTRRYKDYQAGSDYIWDQYDKLEQKLLAYYEEATPAE